MQHASLPELTFYGALDRLCWYEEVAIIENEDCVWFLIQPGLGSL